MYYEHKFESNIKPGTNEGKCVYPVERFEPDENKGWINQRGIRVSESPCNGVWTDVAHPPDQFRHWCSVLEAGGDCMHFEDYS